MRYTTLGRSGLTVSRLCLGCMSYGDKNWRPWVLSEDEARPFFAMAIENGINFFDTSNMYSLGMSEEITGRMLRSMARMDEIVLATKVFYPMRGDAPNMHGLSRKHIVQACEASLARLGVETIDLYQIHRFDPITPIEETLAALDQLVRQGKVRYIGASSGYAWQLARALYTSDSHGWARFQSMQNHYNLLYREEEREMIPLCLAEGLGVIPWSPLARGLLARGARVGGSIDATARSENDAFARGLYDQPSDDYVLAALRQVASERTTSPAEVALAWLLAKPGVAAPIIGATKISHLETALRAVEITLTPEDIEKLEAPYKAHPIKGH
jgi:1-deoxyxylulose-5-phosphate synthase